MYELFNECLVNCAILSSRARTLWNLNGIFGIDGYMRKCEVLLRERLHGYLFKITLAAIMCYTCMFYTRVFFYSFAEAFSFFITL